MVDEARSSGTRRVLVVDDDWDVAATLTALVKLAGYEVRTAHDGVEAVARAEEYLPDVILMDRNAPLEWP